MQTRSQKPWETLEGHRYILLETYRKDGTAVRTPVGFVEDGDTLVFRTIATTGKVKRIRNNPQVRLAPSTGRGEPLGEWMDASAAILPPAENDRVRQLIIARYGLIWRMLELMNRARGRGEWVSIRLSARG
jgi:PPOX class probable F420-dependent enzyme